MARFTKSKVDFLEEKIKESNNKFDQQELKFWKMQYAMTQYSDMDKNDYSKTNAFVARVFPGVKQYLLELPLLWFNIQSYVQLTQENKAFKAPFLFIPHLNGPTNIDAINL